MTPTQTRQRQRKLQIVLWLLVPIAWVAATLFPVRFGLFKLALVTVLALWWLGGIYLVWPHKKLRFMIIALSALPLVLLLPGRTPDKQVLRLMTVQGLQSYDGVPYVWGGETGRGIDCSGLIRRGIMDANLRLGLKTLNPALLREALALWWKDCSAKEMHDGYGGRTVRLFEAKGINSLSDTRLQPGDFAVTSPGGAHTLAYLGDHTWIEADPNALYGFKVIKVRVPTGNAWFAQNVRILRWKQLQ